MAMYIFKNGNLEPLTSEGNVGLSVGAVVSYYGTNNNPGWLLCDGRDTTGTDEELRTHYPALYTYLGNSNVLPDLRECVLVGAGTNDTDTIADHDVYTVGEFKDDQLQDHKHKVIAYQDAGSTILWSLYYWSGGRDASRFNEGNYTKATTITDARTGTTTHGKQKGVNYYIKATSAGPEVDYDVFATKGYIRDQNKLSEWESITLPTTEATAITMEYDGELFCVYGIRGSTYAYVYINGLDFNIGESPAVAYGNNVSGCLPVKKGDVIYSNFVPSRARIAYYKLRDYSDR